MFRFEIQDVDYLSGAEVWLLSGKVLSGELKNGTVLFVENKNQKLKIDTVAFIDPPKFTDNSKITLTTKDQLPNSVDLVGKILSSAKVKKEELSTV